MRTVEFLGYGDSWRLLLYHHDSSIHQLFLLQCIGGSRSAVQSGSTKDRACEVSLLRDMIRQHHSVI